jgi:hypothetical protein
LFQVLFLSGPSNHCQYWFENGRNGMKSLSKKLGTSQIERMGKGWVVLG